MDDLRDVVLAEQAHEEGLGHLGITVFLKEEVEDGSVFIHSPPQPELDPQAFISTRSNSQDVQRGQRIMP